MRGDRLEGTHHFVQERMPEEMQGLRPPCPPLEQEGVPAPCAKPTAKLRVGLHPDHPVLVEQRQAVT